MRPFERERDLAALLDLVGRARAQDDAGEIMHPGGLQWWLRRLGRPGFEVAALSEGAALLAFVLRDGDEMIVQAVAQHSGRRAELLRWVEAHARERREQEILISVAETDDVLRQMLLSRGYAPVAREGYELVADLSDDPGLPDVPHGFEMISLTPPLTERYIALHRAAWSRPERPSTYDREQHDLVTAMPDFRYDMVPIAVAPDGTLAAYCMSWWDPRSRSVEIEPLGTHPEFRRRGLARAIVREVLRRSWVEGAKYVLVWGTSELPDAKALYESAGMRARRSLQDYRLALDA